MSTGPDTDASGRSQLHSDRREEEQRMKEKIWSWIPFDFYSVRPTRQEHDEQG